MYRVITAQPFLGGGQLGSFGNARYVLLCQHQFPDTFDELDKVHSADHDRIQMWDWDHASACRQRHLGTGPMAISSWALEATPEKLMAFAKDALKADPKVKWTGCRILGTVNQSNGYPVFTIELFAKHPDTDTKVYSGMSGPNVKRMRPVMTPEGRVEIGFSEEEWMEDEQS